MTLGSEVGTGLADYGRFRAIEGLIIGLLIALILIIAGYIMTRDKETASALMTVTAVTSCEPVTSISQNQQMGGYGVTNTISTTYNCVVDVSFSSTKGIIDAKNVSVVSKTPLTVGSVVSLRYNPNQPTTVSQEMNPEWGYALAGLGVLIGLGSVGMTFWTYHSKNVAEVQGAVGLYNLIR